MNLSLAVVNEHRLQALLAKIDKTAPAADISDAMLDAFWTVYPMAEAESAMTWHDRNIGLFLG